MLPKPFRLQDQKEIEFIKKEGKLFQSPFFGLLVLKRKDPRNSCFSFIISTKISKKAVERNHAKRLLSETLFKFLPLMKPGLGIVFLAKKNLMGKDQSKIKEEMEKVFRAANLLVEDQRN